MTAVRDGMSLEDLAALVCATLERHGIQAVLSGGSVVSIYSDNEYQSYDLDFIPTGLARRADPAMEELGFRRDGRHWTHSSTKYLVEFPPGPVQVGDAVVTEFAERRTSYGVLRLLGPTECVMDRLAGFYHWKDAQCFDQAVAVARRHPIDLARIEDWSRREHAEAKFQEFVERLRSEQLTLRSPRTVIRPGDAPARLGENLYASLPNRRMRPTRDQVSGRGLPGRLATSG